MSTYNRILWYSYINFFISPLLYMNVYLSVPEFPIWLEQIKEMAPNKKINKLHIDFMNNINDVIKVIKDDKIDIIVPTSHNAMFLVIDNIDLIKPLVKKIICPPNKESILTLYDKCLFTQFMKLHKLDNHVPQSYFIYDNKKIVFCENLKTITFPCILKLSVTYGGIGSYVITDMKELYQKINENKDQNYVIEKYLDNPDEYGGYFYVYEGEIKFAVYYKHTTKEKYYIQRGRYMNYEVVKDFAKQEAFYKVFKILNFTGFANANFKIVDGVVKMFEINPRLGGSLVHNKGDLDMCFASLHSS